MTTSSGQQSTRLVTEPDYSSGRRLLQQWSPYITAVVAVYYSSGRRLLQQRSTAYYSSSQRLL